MKTVPVKAVVLFLVACLLPGVSDAQYVLSRDVLVLLEVSYPQYAIPHEVLVGIDTVYAQTFRYLQQPDLWDQGNEALRESIDRRLGELSTAPTTCLLLASSAIQGRLLRNLTALRRLAAPGEEGLFGDSVQVWQKGMAKALNTLAAYQERNAQVSPVVDRTFSRILQELQPPIAAIGAQTTRATRQLAKVYREARLSIYHSLYLEFQHIKAGLVCPIKDTVTHPMLMQGIDSFPISHTVTPPPGPKWLERIGIAVVGIAVGFGIYEIFFSNDSSPVNGTVIVPIRR